MCDPARLTALYKAVIEHTIGVTTSTSDNDRALVIARDDSPTCCPEVPCMSGNRCLARHAGTVA